MAFMKARLLTKWGEYQAGDVIEDISVLESPIPSHAAVFFDNDVQPVAVDDIYTPKAAPTKVARKRAKR